MALEMWEVNASYSQLDPASNAPKPWTLNQKILAGFLGLCQAFVLGSFWWTAADTWSIATLCFGWYLAIVLIGCYIHGILFGYSTWYIVRQRKRQAGTYISDLPKWARWLIGFTLVIYVLVNIASVAMFGFVVWARTSTMAPVNGSMNFPQLSSAVESVV